MKKYLIVALVALSVITAFGFLIHQNKKLRRERDAYHNNTEVLLSEVERYQTKSGEQAVRVGELQLRVAELERYRADDAALIRDMGVKKKELEQYSSRPFTSCRARPAIPFLSRSHPTGPPRFRQGAPSITTNGSISRAAFSPIIATRPTS